jgi:hypothetical protein
MFGETFKSFKITNPKGDQSYCQTDNPFSEGQFFHYLIHFVWCYNAYWTNEQILEQKYYLRDQKNICVNDRTSYIWYVYIQNITFKEIVLIQHM